MAANRDGWLSALVGKISPELGLAVNLREFSGRVDSEEIRDLFQKTIDRGFEPIRAGVGSTHEAFAVQGLLQNFNRWAAEHALAAAEWIANQGNTPAALAMAAQLPAAQAAKDPAAATASLNVLPPHVQQGAAITLARATLERGTAGVVAVSQGITDTSVRDRYLQTAFRDLIQSDPQAVLDRISLISDPALRQQIQKK